jgi:hypothetical protein
LSSKKEHGNAHPGYPESKDRLYNENAGSEPARTTRNASPAETLRVILPDEPPRLNPAAARALLRILIKAHDRLEKPDNPQGIDAE